MQPNVIILGGGAAGLSVGLNLLEEGFKKVQLISGGGSASMIAPWNVMVASKALFRDALLKTGCHRNNALIMESFLENISSGYNFFKKAGVKTRASNIGFVPAYRRPGHATVTILEKAFQQKGGRIRRCSVNGLLLKHNRVVGLLSEGKTIFGDAFVFAFGGLGNLYSFSTYNSANYGLLALALQAGSKLSDVEFNMFHPFFIVDKRLPRTLLSGSLLQNMRFKDCKGREFLSEETREALRKNKYHFIFSAMNREFYLQGIKGPIWAEIELEKNDFEEYRKRDEFGWIFEGKPLEQIKRFEIHPAFHYSLGGMKVDAKGRTSFENAFALGECSSGLHGASRIGGTSVLECLVFGKIVAEEIAASSFAMQTKSFCKKYVVPRITSKEKDLFWRTLGPVKASQKLKKIVELNSENPYIKLLQECAKASLETGNVGTNFIVDST